MNLALPALILFFLVLPGFILAVSYRARLGRKAPETLLPGGGLTSSWAAALVLAPLAHLLWVPLSAAIAPMQPDLKAVLILLSGFYDSRDEFQHAITAVTARPGLIACYFSTLYLFCFVTGFLAHSFVRFTHADRRIPALSFSNRWHYLFSGELLEIDLQDSFVWIAVTVEQGGQVYLYAGVLAHYDIDQDGSLLRLEFHEGAWRRRLSDDAEQIGCVEAVYGNDQVKEAVPTTIDNHGVAVTDAQARRFPDSRYYEIRGNHFVISCRHIQTVNVEFLRIESALPQAAANEDEPAQVAVAGHVSVI